MFAACLCISRQCVELALVPQNGTAQCRHHDANCPTGVSLQLDDLISTVNIHPDNSVQISQTLGDSAVQSTVHEYLSKSKSFGHYFT